MIHTIIRWPAKALSSKAAPVVVFDEALKTLSSDMIETLRSHDGWGLAAPQVGVSIRLCVVSARPDATAKTSEVLTLVNPVIVIATGEQRIVEGCLSIPDEAIRVKRALSIKVAAFDLDGKPITFEADGLGAAVLQHEIDHLDGITIADRLPFGQQKALRKKLRAAVNADVNVTVRANTIPTKTPPT